MTYTNLQFHELYLITMFSIILIYMEWNAPFRIKMILDKLTKGKINVTTPVKLLDCFPCFSFWIALLLTFNPLISMGIFITATILDRK